MERAQAQPSFISEADEGYGMKCSCKTQRWWALESLVVNKKFKTTERILNEHPNGWAMPEKMECWLHGKFTMNVESSTAFSYTQKLKLGRQTQLLKNGNDWNELFLIGYFPPEALKVKAFGVLDYGSSKKEFAAPESNEPCSANISLLGVQGHAGGGLNLKIGVNQHCLEQDSLKSLANRQANRCCWSLVRSRWKKFHGIGEFNFAIKELFWENLLIHSPGK